MTLTEQEAIAIQNELRSKVVTHDLPASKYRYVAGVDVEYDATSDMIAGAVVVIDSHNFDVVEVTTHVMKATFPYIPGLFSFREMPPLVEAFNKLTLRPDVIVCDGQGLAHPRRFGLACHLGVELDIPTIGCGKTRLIGEYDRALGQRGYMTNLIDNDEVVGVALTTQTGVNPVFVSIGHMVSLPTACAIVLQMAQRFRLPETTRLADKYAREALLQRV